MPAVPVFGSSTKARTRLAWGLCLPQQSSSGSQALDRRPLPRAMCFVPSAGPACFRAPVGACALCLFWGAGLWPRPSRWMSTIENLRKSLVRDWEPVCSLVGVPSLGPSLPLSPPPCLLPPVGWAGPPQLASSSLELLSPFVL